jgi:hypothetical protein
MIELTAARRQSGPREPPRGHDPPRGNPPPQPWTAERARNFKMPIGKYKGRTVGQIGLVDIAYLEWCAENLDRGIQRAAQVYLAHAEPAGAVRANSGTPGEAKFDEFNRPEQAPPAGGSEFNEFQESS